MLYTRRDIGKLALASLPASLALGAAINSKFGGVQIGAITYSFRSMGDAEAMLKAYVEVGLGEMELMSNDCESLAGAPRMPGFGGFGGGNRGGGRGPGGGPGAMAAGQAA